MAFINPLDLKLLAWLDAIASANRGGQNDLSVARHSGLHE
jgi:hypothetical protein